MARIRAEYDEYNGNNDGQQMDNLYDHANLVVDSSTRDSDFISLHWEEEVEDLSY